MITRKYLKTKAIILLMVAFTFLSCRPPIREKKLVKPPPDYFSIAEDYFHNQRLKDALTYYRQYVDNYPEGKNVPKALLKMGEIEYQFGNYEDAVSIYKSFLEKYPGSETAPTAQYKLALCLRNENKTQDVITLTRKWLNTYPNHPLKEDVFHLLISSLIDEGLVQEALSEYARGIKNRPISDETKDKIVDLFTPYIKEADIPSLLKIKDIIRNTPLYPQISYSLALEYFKNLNFLKSKEELDELIRTTEDKEWILKARALINQIMTKFQKEKRKIGCILPLSGEAAFFGKETLRGILLAMFPFDEEGDPEIQIIDNRGEIEATKDALNKLIADPEVKVIIGPLLSKTAVISAEIAQSNHIPIITFTHKENITSIGDMVYRNFITPERYIDTVLGKAINKMGIKRFAVLFPDTNYGNTYMNLFVKKAEELGGEVTAIEPYKPDETDFTTHIKNLTGLSNPNDEYIKNKIQELRALMAEEEIDDSLFSQEEPFPIVNFEGLFIPDSGERVAMIIPQFPFMNVSDICFIGTEAWLSPQLIANAGEYMDLSIFPAPFFPENPSPEVREFVTRYRMNFGSEPGTLSALGYETIRMLVDLINSRLVISREDMNQALKEFKGTEGLTGFIRFDEKGDVIKRPILLTVKGRRFSLYK